MLMPPSEWPLKTIAVRIFAYVHPPTPLQTRHKISRLLDQSSRNFYKM